MAVHPDKYPLQTSGVIQHVAIAQAIIVELRFLLMGEPIGALNPDTREDLQLFLLELWESHRMTIFFVDHDPEETLFVGTRILFLWAYVLR